MRESTRFIDTKARILEQIKHSKNPEDLSHAINTAEWIVRLRPDADEILQLAGLAHDIQRSVADRLTKDDFATLDEYLKAHAARSGAIAAQLIIVSGYSEKDARRLEHIISRGEFHSDEPDVQLLRDANSISVFDNNTIFYIRDKGKEWTQEKMQQNYDNASSLAKKHIQDLLRKRPDQNLLSL